MRYYWYIYVYIYIYTRAYWSTHLACTYICFFYMVTTWKFHSEDTLNSISVADIFVLKQTRLVGKLRVLLCSETPIVDMLYYIYIHHDIRTYGWYICLGTLPVVYARVLMFLLDWAEKLLGRWKLGHGEVVERAICLMFFFGCFSLLQLST